MARLRQKLDRAEWAKLPQDRQSDYTERNGEYVLDTDDNEALRTAYDRTKADLAAAKTRLDSMKDYNPDEYERLKTAADQAAREKEIEKGNFEKLAAQDRTKYEDDLKKVNEKTLALRAQLEEGIVDGAITRAIISKYPGAKLTPILLGAKQVVKPMEIGGRLRAVVLDEKGEPRLRAGAKTTDDYMPPEDYIDEMRNNKEWAGNFPATAVGTPGKAQTLVSSPQVRAQKDAIASIMQQVADGNSRIG